MFQLVYQSVRNIKYIKFNFLMMDTGLPYICKFIEDRVGSTHCVGVFCKVISIPRKCINCPKLVVVVEADEDLSLELLPLDARTHRPDPRYTWVR